MALTILPARGTCDVSGLMRCFAAPGEMDFPKVKQWWTQFSSVVKIQSP